MGRDSPGQIRTAVARSPLGRTGRSRASNHWPPTAPIDRDWPLDHGAAARSNRQDVFLIFLRGAVLKPAEHPILRQNREERCGPRSSLGSEEDEIKIPEEAGRVHRQGSRLLEAAPRLP